jgi:hypothetical protein
MSDLNIESRVIFAINAKRKSQKLSIRQLAKQFSTSRTTLQARITGRPSKTDTHSQGSNPYHEIHIWIYNVDPYPFHSIPRRLQHFHIHATESLPHVPHVETVARNGNIAKV